jgi:glycosyltransferase involved in cell wall biosynthesis
LGIICGDWITRDPSGQLMVSHAFGRLVDAIRELIPDTKLCMPVIDGTHPGVDHPLQLAEEQIVSLPPMKSTIAAQKYFFRARRTIRAFAASCDVVHVRLPFVLPRALLDLKRPKVVHAVGDVTAVIRVSTDYKGPLRLAALAFARDAESVSRRLVREPMTRAVTHGQELWDVLRCEHGRTVVSSCIRRDEMLPRVDQRLGDPPKILFVGYLRPEKGADVLCKAFEMLRAKRRLSWTIVGGTDRAQSDTERTIHAMLDASPYRADINFVGNLPFGEALFDLYRQHDVFVLASLSEGTPRTLVEARAFGCPVVATAVGGVPASVTDDVDGLLIPPNDSAATAAAIERILDDEALRLRLIAGGLARTSQLSVEDFALNLVEEIDLAVNMRK